MRSDCGINFTVPTLCYLKVQNVIKWVNKKRLSKNGLFKKNKLYVERTPQTCHHLVNDCPKYVEVGTNF